MAFRVNSEFIKRNWALGNKADKFANARRWNVALTAYRAVGKRDGTTQQIANAIYEANNLETPLEDSPDAPTDTVERLAHAYRYFAMLLTVDARRAINCRRRFGYSRFAMMYGLWLSYEFDIRERGFDYLELGMSNKGLELFVTDTENQTPEWKRRSASLYSNACKLVDDLDVPAELRTAADDYIKAYDVVFPKVTKNIKRKV